ncbi:hypothetical protein GSI_12837 [Ganoderma sinense ZZ0214-1]|uniref:Uncharacterized protein n=1 Tax=Ganoderma sinense ZZ0214-1 TaxID=1077348 RepID=A0A2G8RTW7_9APHY|nr:hypothetical protein GSI_12837 [Ganoderma sinense ZZ0214-1]
MDDLQATRRPLLQDQLHYHREPGQFVRRARPPDLHSEAHALRRRQNAILIALPPVREPTLQYQRIRAGDVVRRRDSHAHVLKELPAGRVCLLRVLGREQLVARRLEAEQRPEPLSPRRRGEDERPVGQTGSRGRGRERHRAAALLEAVPLVVWSGLRLAILRVLAFDVDGEAG